MDRWSGAGGRATVFPVSTDLVIFFAKVIGLALLLAISAKLSISLPGTPVPATLQSLAVLFAGGLLGPVGGLISVTTYLCAGMAGAPVFAFGGGPAYLAGPTGGYLLGFIPAVWVAGIASNRTRRLTGLSAGFLLATLLIHLSGWAQLAILAGPSAAWKMGVWPFLAWDALKAVLAAALILRLRRKQPRALHGPEGSQG